MNESAKIRVAKARLEIARIECAYLKDAMTRLEAVGEEGAGSEGELRRVTMEWKKAEQRLVITQVGLEQAEEEES